jgi:N-acetylglucosaminyldiphosphoundecaprenol N-acetyl-beta-D-mannosaminyltransferase
LSGAARTSSIARLDLLGVGVSAVGMETALACIEGWIRERRRDYVCVTGVHGIMESLRDDAVRRAHAAAGLVVPDGMPLVWLLKEAGFLGVGRVYGPDLMLAALARGEAAGYRHYLYGGTPATLARLRSRLGARFPRAAIVGAHAPPFRPAGADETEDMLTAIDASGADIVWVGLGTPKQELWMAKHRARLAAPALIGVGAAFDFHAGTMRQAPARLQRLGLEWAFRMAMEPRRLAGRYLRNNPSFVFLLVAQRLGLKRFPMA